MKMKRIILAFAVATMAMGMQSCGQTRPENNDGHNLWLGDITAPVNAPLKEKLSKYDSQLGDEGFRIRKNDKGEAVIYANTDAGLMYGTYHLKRLGDCGDLSKLDKEIVEVPAFKYRILNHWDNPNLTVERGYAGKSLWKWEELPGKIRPEYEEYARANASIGINGTVLNNVNADALKPYGGIVMWRAFVYAPESPDRAKQAVEEFKPLDGQFRDNVIIQIKNGPVDFQPREPFSPLFGQLEHTNVMAEMQITQEYLGHSNHMVYLHPMWKECLDSDTYQKGEGSTVAAETLGKVHGNSQWSAIAGVTNIGDSVNWCGHHMAQANWYAFGRMAWNPDLSSEQIIDEWIKQTFTADKKFVEPVAKMLLESREACVKYEMPMGLHHCFSGAGHYGPGPWDRSSRPDWEPAYYHKAAADGIGFDRTSKTGTDAVSQYHEPLRSLYDNVDTCPKELILWFHHLPWDYKMKSGRTLWNELCYTFEEGIQEARGFISTWESVEKYVDPYRYGQIHDKLVRQAKDAIWWRDALMLYFQTFSNMPIPDDCTKPQHTLDELRRFRLRISNYETPALDKLPEYTLE